jgi:hypothetical protein
VWTLSIVCSQQARNLCKVIYTCVFEFQAIRKERWYYRDVLTGMTPSPTWCNRDRQTISLRFQWIAIQWIVLRFSCWLFARPLFTNLLYVPGLPKNRFKRLCRPLPIYHGSASTIFCTTQPIPRLDSERKHPPSARHLVATGDYRITGYTSNIPVRKSEMPQRLRCRRLGTS